MGLCIFVVVFGKFGEYVVPVAGFHFLDQIVGLFPADPHEMSGKLQIRAVPRHTVQLDKGKLNLLMAGAAAALAFAGAEHAADQIREAARHIQQAALAGGLVVGDGGFDQVAAAVKLVSLRQILPAVFRMLNGDVGIEIAVVLLRAGNEIDRLVRQALKLGSRTILNTERHGFNPFVEVGILENGALVASLPLPRRDAEIIQTMGRFHIRQAIVEGFPLVGNDLFRHIAHIAAEELVRNADLVRLQRHPSLLHLHMPRFFPVNGGKPFT